ncbi:hypothetical protein M9H77_02843 [Catharanthus roseus]|uniref:Uncharacterized protein n=1 Tax=Catharanthus roseus TaxID=4058 RepID=A0ACC0C9Q1_CATRO|nr:hypothetical protein M9H77_02843 [Catharanthus roseus]
MNFIEKHLLIQDLPPPVGFRSKVVLRIRPTSVSHFYREANSLSGYLPTLYISSNTYVSVVPSCKTKRNPLPRFEPPSAPSLPPPRRPISARNNSSSLSFTFLCRYSVSKNKNSYNYHPPPCLYRYLHQLYASQEAYESVPPLVSQPFYICLTALPS